MSLKLGILADTHNKVPSSLFDVFQDVELILHAGDVMDEATRNEIESIAPVRLVRGNNDGALSLVYPDHDLVEWQGLRLGMTHGHLFPWGERGLFKMVEYFRLMRPDLIICGHSHAFMDQMVAGTRVVNPGSAGLHWFGRAPSAAILTRHDGDGYEIERVDL